MHQIINFYFDRLVCLRIPNFPILLKLICGGENLVLKDYFHSALTQGSHLWHLLRFHIKK